LLSILIIYIKNARNARIYLHIKKIHYKLKRAKRALKGYMILLNKHSLQDSSYMNLGALFVDIIKKIALQVVSNISKAPKFYKFFQREY
tara:strand:+ start:421 stop:687 length:267 start_codon:yes stop_codon:yes gene_type:complete